MTIVYITFSICKDLSCNFGESAVLYLVQERCYTGKAVAPLPFPARIPGKDGKHIEPELTVN